MLGNYFHGVLLCAWLIKWSWAAMDEMVQEAAIYASRSKNGEHIAWSRHPDWSNLDSILMDSGVTDIAEICTQGTWLLYEKPEFEVVEKSGYRMMTGESNCLVKPGKVMSMQPFGAEGEPDGSSITFFKEKYFGAKAFPLSKDTTQRTMDLFADSVQSLITVGTEGWSLLLQSPDASTKTVCIKPEPVGPMIVPVCSLQSVHLTLLQSNTKVLFVNKGCDQAVDAASTLIVSDCAPFQTPRSAVIIEDPSGSINFCPEAALILLYTYVSGDNGTDSVGVPEEPERPVKPPNKLFCEGTSANPELTVLLRFLKLRRENDFRNEPVIPWTNDNEKTWKSELADLTFNMAMITCPSVAVSHEFLQMVREAFMFELQEVWTNVQPDVDNEQLHLLITQLEKCYFRAKQGASLKVNTLTKQRILRSMPFSDHRSIDPHLRWNNSNNLAIDVAWMAGNLVASLCHTTFQYKNNFWYNYINVFNKLYLQPLAKSYNWRNGLASRQRYDYSLSGFGIDIQLSGFAICVSNAVGINPNMVPFQRPAFQ